MPKELSPPIQKLKAWRAANGFSQSHAVRVLQDAGLPIKLSTLQQWEIGRSAPYPVTAAALETFLATQSRRADTADISRKRRIVPIIAKLKAWRASNSLSQSQAVRILVAAGLPVKLRTLQTWESESHAPHHLAAVALNRFLDEYPTPPFPDRPLTD
jgi:DNA-binding transcriptional regulator YiaG